MNQARFHSTLVEPEAHLVGLGVPLRPDRLTDGELAPTAMTFTFLVSTEPPCISTDRSTCDRRTNAPVPLDDFDMDKPWRGFGGGRCSQPLSGSAEEKTV